MNIVSVCAVCVFAVICAAALRKYSPETSSLLLTAAVVMTALCMLPYFQKVINSIEAFSDSAQIKPIYIESLVKSVGICCLTRIAADICRENGGQSAAAQTELCGRIAILIIACPLYGELISAISDFLR
ncbi:MAG: hypothetical protein IIZ59_02325 [Clostridia bacterium]|nr:hypothetical protein [Clostridia bacterium]